jgi:hypothetical protein
MNSVQKRAIFGSGAIFGVCSLRYGSLALLLQLQVIETGKPAQAPKGADDGRRETDR